jgi:L-fuculose-phosphate aldolase
MPTPITFDPVLGRQFIKYARLVAGRGYVHNTLGNMVMRAGHPDFPHGLAYTKHAEISLEEMELENIVITDVPTSRIVWGNRMTSVGHNLSREILRLRPDIGATIHVHDDAIIALLGGLGNSAALPEFNVLSLDPPFVLGKPVHFVPAHVDVEADVSGVAAFIQDTNAIVLVGHGITTMGRSISEAYHRLNTLTAEVRRCIVAEQIAALKGTRPAYRSRAEIEEMYRFAERVIYPTRPDNVMHEEAAE